MGYLIAAYAVSLLGLVGYAYWLWRARREMRARLGRDAAQDARGLTSENAPEY